MKKILAQLAFAAVLLLTACNPEGKHSPGKIDIDFLFDEIEVDLNIADNPYITCVINSTAGLKSVQLFINWEDGSRTQYKEDIVTFFNPCLVSIYERPVYSETMTGMTVRATDLGGKTEEKTVSFEVHPTVFAPRVKFTSESITFEEGDPVAPFGFSVAAMAPLSKVSVELIAGGEVFQLVEDITSFADPMYFDFKSSDYPVAEYDPNKIPASIRVTATDTYGKVSMVLLPINFKSLPFPELSVDKPTTAVDEFTPLTISGNASSESLIVEVSCYAVAEKYEHLAATLAIDEKASTEFSLTLPGEEIQDFVTGIKVSAKDFKGKVTSKTVPVSIVPGFYSVAADADLDALLGTLSTDNRFRSIKLALPAGAEYSLGASAITLTKSLHIKGTGAGVQPVVATTAGEPIHTDGLNADYVKFENIHFRSDKSSNASFINNAGGCSIGTISVKGCLFDGTYGNYLLRCGGNCKIGSIVIDDSIFRWKNTNSTYSFLHITNNTDRVDAISITNSTIEGVFYFIYNNEKETICDIAVSNCTFANSKGSNDSYFISIGQSTLKGSISMKKCLFGGSCSITGTSRFFLTKSLVADNADNFCTKSWMSFRINTSTSGVYYPVTTLPDNEDNGQVFEDAESFDLTLKSGTSVYNAGIGDPRWKK